MERKKSSVFSFLTRTERFVVQGQLLGGLDKNMEQSSWSLWSHNKKKENVKVVVLHLGPGGEVYSVA